MEVQDHQTIPPSIPFSAKRYGSSRRVNGTPREERGSCNVYLNNTFHTINRSHCRSFHIQKTKDIDTGWSMHILAFINHLTIANNNNKFNSQVLQQHIREHKIKKKKKKTFEIWEIEIGLYQSLEFGFWPAKASTNYHLNPNKQTKFLTK